MSEYFAAPVEFEFFDYMMRDTDAFKKALFDAIFFASSEDKAKLAKVYPEHVECVERYQTEPGYFKTICVKVENS